MKLIVGLGNPGEKYEKTRHNLGFSVIEAFLKNSTPVKKTNWDNSKKFSSEIYIFSWQPKKGNEEKIILVKPLTFMNNSGLAVKNIASFYKIKSDDIWVLHDEIDLPIGLMKIRLGGSSAGHRGVESIIEHLKTEKFWRFRLGIGVEKRKKEDKSRKIREISQMVLGKFGEGEKGKVRTIIKRGAESIEYALEKDLVSAMNRYNSK